VTSVEIDLAQLDGLAAGLLETGMAPAAAVALTTPEGTLTARTYGTASPASPWPIGSIGKSFTAVIALQLADEGLLDLHAPVTHYLPWLSLRGRLAPVTTHHLLTHSAGVIESSDLAPASTYDVIALAATEPGFSPSEHRHYSNIGYRAVGVLLEAVTERPYADLLQRRVLDRLDMDSSHAVMVHDTRRLLPGGNVPFYDDRPWQPDHGLAPAPWVESAEADGCPCCTPEDLAAYLRALWTGGKLLSPASLGAMKRAQPPHEPEGEPYGYGLEIHDDGFGHSGDMLGYVAHMRADTAAGLGVVAFANGIGGAWYLGEGALAIAAGREPPELDTAPAEPLVDDGTGPPEWTPFVGRFRSHNPWLPTFSIASHSGGLIAGTEWMNGSERLPLTPLDGDRFRVGEPDWSPERMQFDTVIDGRAQRAVYSGTPYYRAFTGR
jgi:CubicO group peptidase (beta-lactamase class C family)